MRDPIRGTRKMARQVAVEIKKQRGEDDADIDFLATLLIEALDLIDEFNSNQERAEAVIFTVLAWIQILGEFHAAEKEEDDIVH